MALDLRTLVGLLTSTIYKAPEKPAAENMGQHIMDKEPMELTRKVCLPGAQESNTQSEVILGGRGWEGKRKSAGILPQRKLTNQ